MPCDARVFYEVCAFQENICISCEIIYNLKWRPFCAGS